MIGSVFDIFAPRKGKPLVESDLVYLRIPALSDYQDWANLRRASQKFLTPWEPTWHADDLTRRGYRQRLRRYTFDLRMGLAQPLFLFRRSDDQLLGGLTIGHIHRGAAHSCMIGYWMGEAFAGRGYMSAALSASIPHMFGSLGLHRIEAACIPGNDRSIRLLKSHGFQEEGYMREYLKINGKWEDHILFARVSGDQPGTKFRTREQAGETADIAFARPTKKKQNA